MELLFTLRFFTNAKRGEKKAQRKKKSFVWWALSGQTELMMLIFSFTMR